MEEKPPTQAGREGSRSRTPRAAFSTPEQPAPQSKPAERAPRRAAKAAAPVTFQPPSGEDSAPSGTDAASPKATPPAARSGGSSESRRKPAAPRKGQTPRQGRTAQTGKDAPADTAETSPASTSSAEGASTADPAPQAAIPPAAAVPSATSPAEPPKTPPVEAAPSASPAAESATTPPAGAVPSTTTPAKAAKASGRSRRKSASKATPAVLAKTTPANTETDRTETATTPAQQESASRAQPSDEPVKATPPRSEGIEGAPTPLIPDQPLPAAPAKAAPAPARKSTRRAGRATAQPAGAASARPATTPDAGVQATPGQRTPIRAAEATDKAEPADQTQAREEPATATDGDRTGATPIPPDDKPAAPAEKDKPADEQRTGAEPIPAADEQPQGQAQQHKETRIVATRPPAVEPPARTPALAEAAASRTEPWAKLVADPGHAPELLALAAVQTIGPRAAEWARQHREAYPQATDDALARLAVAQFIRFGSVGSVFAAVAGSYAPIALLGSNALTYAEIVLHVAAAHGQDPTDRQRAVDLLVLAQVHPSREDAEAALATAEQPAYEEETRLTDAVWRLGRMVAAQAAAWTVLRGLNRFLPGTTMLAAIMTSRNGARTMGSKATAYYRAGR